MTNKNRIAKKLGLLTCVTVMASLSATLPNEAYAAEENTKLTIVGTTDLHGNIYNWSYENGEEVEDMGMAKVYSVIEDIRAENPNTLLIDNGDAIQGTILTDDLYNTDLSLTNPVIDVMNFMGYDAMTLGNHEFNFGLDLVDKIMDEAEFPILAANIKHKEDNSYFALPYTIVEVDGIDVGIIGFTNPNIPKWDGPKVTELEFEDFLTAAEAPMQELNEQADVIIASSHSSYTGGYEETGGYINDDAQKILEAYPEISALLVGHSHSAVEEMYDGTAVGGAIDAGEQVVRFDLEISQEGEEYTVESSTVDLISVESYAASEELKTYAAEYHANTLDFLDEVIGQASGDFVPESEVAGIPEAQLQDTAVIDLINNVQLAATGADVAGAALFNRDSNLEAGDLSYADIFDIYKYPNTLVGVEVTGAQLKEYMEWSADYYNQYTEGDVTISFDPEIRGYNYDMFQGVDYKVDISKPKGERIVDVMFNGEPLEDDQVLKLAINNYRYGGLSGMGIVTEDPYFESDPKSLRSYIADTIREAGTIDPETDNNWEIVGADLDHPLRDYIIAEVNAGNIELPVAEDGGRSFNSKALNVYELIDNGVIPESVLIEYGLIEDPEAPEDEEEQEEEEEETETPEETEEPVEEEEEQEEDKEDDEKDTDKDSDSDKDTDDEKDSDKDSEEEGERLPETATATWTLGLIGLGSVSLGSAAHFFKKKVK
ncbi:2',3'-cyclic-nucleotide 2'-phosphodiesterase / 3'-nucleotidase [Alkalibacterium subtropicum]|uniref:2',3'-cyclic-nucleotide 2'-phosphodiesterase / 3'-nucleotidase n=1 Tax=Alkalibacterium subtropicum TaxID=753702 RepID=A0A1I1IZB4_9LACT|nr:5'-nucleotidase C-terminal domain-containing protein [Alkalibacterium subtropicum]SFC41604.1 2',3'-cyclic-nucleotide 2'-phosphodiesterase / 3'-nucleotidase [Alkalibacterium subtropicum]